MYELKVIGIEGENLLASSENGERYLLVVDDVLHSQLRQLGRQERPQARFSPREVQSLLREGVPAGEVAERTGASLEDVERFAGPVLAEQDHIVRSAQAVSVDLGPAADDDAPTTFGGVISRRLSDQGAEQESWSALKPGAEGWQVRVSYLLGEVEREALWGFDPKRGLLTPLNRDATTLSRVAEPREGLIPRLRAVETHPEPLRPVERTAAEPGSGQPDHADARERSAEAHAPAERTRERVVEEPVRLAVATGAQDTHGQGYTADLLDALRRRRGERELAPVEPLAPAPGPSSGPTGVGLSPAEHAAESDDARPFTLAFPDPPGEAENATPTLDIPIVSAAEAAESGAPAGAGAAAREQEEGSRASSRRGRASMPSWDEIVFGRRNDDDDAS